MAVFTYVDALTLFSATPPGTTHLVIPATNSNAEPYTEIGVMAFKAIIPFGITSVTIPSSVTSIGDQAFAQNRLTSVTIPSSVTSIGDQAFALNELTSASIPGSVTTIGDFAFALNRLTSVTISSSVASIGAFAFQGNLLTSATIPSSVTSIGSSAFAGNQLKLVVLPWGSLYASSSTYGLQPRAGGQVVYSDSPTDISSSSVSGSGALSFDENLPAGSVVGIFGTADPDPAGTPAASFAYTLVDGVGAEDNGSFFLMATRCA